MYRTHLILSSIAIATIAYIVSLKSDYGILKEDNDTLKEDNCKLKVKYEVLKNKYDIMEKERDNWQENYNKILDRVLEGTYMTECVKIVTPLAEELRKCKRDEDSMNFIPQLKNLFNIGWWAKNVLTKALELLGYGTSQIRHISHDSAP